MNIDSRWWGRPSTSHRRASAVGSIAERGWRPFHVLHRSRAHTIRLEYQLDNFSTLRDYVLQHTPPATRAKQTGGSVFYRMWINKSILLFFFPFMVGATAGSFAAGHRALPVLFFAIAALDLVRVTRDPLSLTIESDRVVIRYPGWKRDIAFSDIASVALSKTAVVSEVVCVVCTR